MVLGVVLAVLGLVVPDSAVHPTDLTLVKVRSATASTLDQDVVWILAVGSDARPGQDMTRSRGDALQLIGMNTRTGAATAIGIPRDSYVSIPGQGRDKINAALFLGGPQLMARAVEDLVGIRADYVFVTRFKKFIAMADEIGPIRVDNPRAFADPNLKDDGFDRGRITLTGYDAMAFSRIRYNLPGGDFDRSANQQRTLRGIHERIRQRASQRGFMESGVLSVLANMSTDGVSPADLFRLAHAVAAVRPERITTCVVQGTIGTAGAASIVLPDRAQAARLGAEARRDATLESC
ncbi:MAG: LCP family protein [Nocardioides sp.]|nr:LCP family protein [Nocardioides sp.]